MRLALAGALLAAAFAAQADPSVAFVADVHGSATIEGDGRLGFLAELASGSRVLLGSGATATITFAATGAEFTLAGPGEFSIGANEIKAEKGAPPKRRSVATLSDTTVVARVSRGATASVRMRSLGTEAAALEYPLDTRIATLQPTMRIRGGADYTITIVDAAGKAVWSGPATAQGVKVATRLAPGARYGWSATSPRGTLGPASFETLPSDAIARVEKARASARTFPDRVMGALMLQELGATQDAREAWAGLARERPDLPELAAYAR
jgi:hypothetical protein